MKKGGFPTVAWILLGLLGLAALLISLGQREAQVRPVTESYSASGTAALAQLLRQNGFNVRVDKSKRPAVGAGDVVVVFYVGSHFVSWEEEEEEEDLFTGSLRRALRKGAAVLMMPIPEDFQTRTRELLKRDPVPVVRFDGAKRSVRAAQGGYATFPNLGDDAEPDAYLWSRDSNSFVDLTTVDQGLLANAQDGTLATNRMIDQADNAEVVVSTIAALASPGGRVVFAEGAVEQREPGLFATIGAWVESAWYQCLFLFAVVIFTLGKRFGLPEEVRPPQRGTRELLDAIADTFLRARATKAGMRAAWQSADAQVRKALKLPRDASAGERNRLLPDSLSRAFARIEAAEKEKRVATGDALKLVADLQREVDDFVGSRSSLSRGRAA